MTSPPDLSVVVATRGRPRALARLLDALSPGAGTREVVVVENGTPSGARDVVAARRSTLALRYLHRSRPGKSAALNRALDEGGLAPVVAFVDDDVVPRPGWADAVLAATARRTDRHVFGGKVEVRWPAGPLPAWATDDPWIRAFGFGYHDPGIGDAPYRDGLFPYGANWWCRRALFERGFRFDPRRGPGAGRWRVGEDTHFLWRLARDGFPAIHVPDAVVAHTVRRDQLRPAWIRHRAFLEGMSRAPLERPPRAAFLRRHPRLWRIEQAARVGRALLAYTAGRLRPPSDAAVMGSARAARRLGADLARLGLRPDAPGPENAP